jgi:nucleoid-associated protein YgaU
MSALCEAEARYSGTQSLRPVRVLAGQPRHVVRAGSAAGSWRPPAVRRPADSAGTVRPEAGRTSAARQAAIRQATALPAAAHFAAARPGAARPAVERVAAWPAPLRLTRRGRRLAGTLAVGMTAVALFVSWLALAGGAQAAGHGVPGAGHAGMTRVIVKPGQTLWVIAAAAEPSADPRAVIAEIMQVNALSSAAIQPGEQLWVPKS